MKGDRGSKVPGPNTHHHTHHAHAGEKKPKARGKPSHSHGSGLQNKSSAAGTTLTNIQEKVEARKQKDGAVGSGKAFTAAPKQFKRKLSNGAQEQIRAGKKKRPNPFLRFLKRLFLPGQLASYTLDSETQEKVGELQMTPKQISKIKHVFDEIDLDGSGSIECIEFLEYIDIPKSPFSDNIFLLVGQNPNGQIEFSQFLLILLEYCMLNRDGILRFCFDKYDADGSGNMDEIEFMELCRVVNNAAPLFPGNFARALEEFDANGDGMIDFDEFREIDKRHPLVLFPAFKLQDSMQKHFLGEAGWNQVRVQLHKNKLIEEYKLTHGGSPPDQKTLKLLMQQTGKH